MYSHQNRLAKRAKLRKAMRFEVLAGLWAILGLASLPLARADATMNAWNQLMIDQLFAGFSPFVSNNNHVWLSMWRKGEGCEVVGIVNSVQGFILI